MITDDFEVEHGQLTFDAEGTEGGPNHSRKPHVPTDSSGVTIGRGYDLKERKKDDVIEDLTNAGMRMAEAEAYADGIGLKGKEARNFIKNNKDKLVDITPKQQKELFGFTYVDMEMDVKRICGKDDVVAKYGKTNWPTLNAHIKEVVIDLRYRGDYSPLTREKIQKHIADNNLTEFKKAMLEEKYWVDERKVPGDRFKRRKEYLETS